MWVRIKVSRQTNANMFKGYDKIVMDVLRAEVMKMNRSYGGALYHIFCSAWPYFVFAQVSAVARILFPMATLEPARWAAQKGFWSLAALHPLDRKSVHEDREMHSHRGKRTFSPFHICVRDFQSNSEWFRGHVSLYKHVRKKNWHLIKETGYSLHHFCFLQKRHPCQVFKTALLLWLQPLYNNAAEAAIS